MDYDQFQILLDSLSTLEMNRPSFLLKPKLYPDGSRWCALYGENLQEGLAGFGKTPNKAMTDFDENFYYQELKGD